MLKIEFHHVKLVAKDYQDAMQQLDFNIKGYVGEVISIDLRREGVIYQENKCHWKAAIGVLTQA